MALTNGATRTDKARVLDFLSKTIHDPSISRWVSLYKHLNSEILVLVYSLFCAEFRKSIKKIFTMFKNFQYLLV